MSDDRAPGSRAHSKQGSGGSAAYRAPLKYARPILLDDVVIDFPDLRIHVEHMAYPWTGEFLALIKHAPNVYTDVTELFSRPTILAWYLMMAKEYGVIKRVVWGSDYDVLWHPERGLAGYFEKVEREPYWLRTELNKTLSRCGWPTLSQSEIDGILGTNARRFLRLTQQASDLPSIGHLSSDPVSCVARCLTNETTAGTRL